MDHSLHVFVRETHTFSILSLARNVHGENLGATSCYGNRNYPLSYRVPVRERYGSTLLPATREQHDQNCTQSH